MKYDPQSPPVVRKVEQLVFSHARIGIPSSPDFGDLITKPVFDIPLRDDSTIPMQIDNYYTVQKGKASAYHLKSLYSIKAHRFNPNPETIEGYHDEYHKYEGSEPDKDCYWFYDMLSPEIQSQILTVVLSKSLSCPRIVGIKEGDTSSHSSAIEQLFTEYRNNEMDEDRLRQRLKNIINTAETPAEIDALEKQILKQAELSRETPEQQLISKATRLNNMLNRSNFTGARQK